MLVADLANCLSYAIAKHCDNDGPLGSEYGDDGSSWATCVATPGLSLQYGLLHVSPLDPHVARNQCSTLRTFGERRASLRCGLPLRRLRGILSPSGIMVKMSLILAHAYNNAKYLCGQEERFWDPELSGA